MGILEQLSDYYQNNLKKDNQKDYQLRYKYSFTLVDYEDLLDFQGGICPICKEPLDKNSAGSESLCLDHDHKTGEIRGILHLRCNLLLGFAKDSKESLKNASVYLDNPSARSFFSRELLDIDIIDD